MVFDGNQWYSIGSFFARDDKPKSELMYSYTYQAKFKKGSSQPIVRHLLVNVLRQGQHVWLQDIGQFH